MSKGMNKTFLSGNLTRDPEMTATKGGTVVANLGIAVNEPVKELDGTWGERANFFNLVAFGHQAEFAERFLSKGSHVFVEGRLRYESWEDRDSGQKRSAVKVVCDNLFFGASKREDDGNGRPAESSSKPRPKPESRQEDFRDVDFGSADDEDDIPF